MKDAVVQCRGVRRRATQWDREYGMDRCWTRTRHESGLCPAHRDQTGSGDPDDRGCEFCAIVFEQAPAEIVSRWGNAVAFVPLNPVTPGHLLVVPVDHVADATENPYITAQLMGRVAELAEAPCNIITSAGAEATQTVFHLHVHIVPRREGDGLLLPWTSPWRRMTISNSNH